MTSLYSHEPGGDMNRLQRALLTLFTLVNGSVFAATGSGSLLFVILKEDPDTSTLFSILIKIAAAGIFVQFVHLLSRTGRDKAMPWQRWLGESALGGVTAYLAAGAAYTFGPPQTPISLSLIGVFGGYFGQRLIVYAANAYAKARNLPPPGGDTDVA
jgi:hypothetical protein